MYHILLMHSSVTRHLGGFHVLVFMNNVAVNMHVHVFQELAFNSLAMYPEMELPDHMVILFLMF